MFDMAVLCTTRMSCAYFVRAEVIKVEERMAIPRDLGHRVRNKGILRTFDAVKGCAKGPRPKAVRRSRRRVSRARRLLVLPLSHDWKQVVRGPRSARKRDITEVFAL